MPLPAGRECISDGGAHGPGYALPNPEDTPYIEELARTEGILLDPVYTGKAFAGMMQLLRQGAFDGQDDLLFVHTGGTAALFAIDLPGDRLFSHTRPETGYEPFEGASDHGIFPRTS